MEVNTLTNQKLMKSPRNADRQREEQERNRIAAMKTQDDKERTLRTKAEWKRFRGIVWKFKDMNYANCTRRRKARS